VGAFLYFERPADSNEMLARLELELNESQQRQHELEQALEHLTDLVNGQATELAALHAEVGELKARRSTIGSSEPLPTPAFTMLPGTIIEQAPTTDSIPDLEDTERLVDQESINRDRMERHDRFLQGEDYDPVWVEATRERVIEVFDQLDGSGSRLNAVDCRVTRCRVSVLHESQESEREFLRNFPMQISSLFPRAAISHFRLEGGGVESVIHLSKRPVR
jgi:hypothetical protein